MNIISTKYAKLLIFFEHCENNDGWLSHMNPIGAKDVNLNSVINHPYYYQLYVKFYYFYINQLPNDHYFQTSLTVPEHS